LLIGILALLFTGLNSLKPLHIDDTAHYYYARQIAVHPLDPYGFEVFWYEQPEAAQHVLTPLLTDYWWALALRCFGERPWLWKVWLLPFSVLFVASLFLLLRRFARGLEATLTVMTVLSPTFLPSLNLMLDVPALALILISLVVFFHAWDGNSLWGAALAGLLAGLAIQTKYTGFQAPAIMLLAVVIRGKLPLGLVALGGAVAVFVAWETVIAWKYGESHFLYHLRDTQSTHVAKYLLALPFLNILGALTPILGLLALAALGAGKRLLVLTGGMILLGYLVVAYVPEGYATYGWRLGRFAEHFTLGDVLFGVFGGGVCAVSLAVLGRLCRWRRGGGIGVPWGRYRLEWFLALWLGLEVAGYFALSPFPAARRVMGVVVVLTVVIGRLAARTCRRGGRRWLVRCLAGLNILLGLGFYGIDLRDAFVEKEAAEDAAALIRAHDAGPIWYVGHWGFQYYAEQSGMMPVVPYWSQLHRGDWLVIPGQPIEQQKIGLSTETTTLLAIRTHFDLLPWRTVVGYYGGRTPLEHREGPRLVVRIYRVTADFTPVPPPPAE
jgi:hypothetical protein